MASDEEAEEGSGPERSPIDQLDLIKSYVSFAGRAVKARKWLAALTFVSVFGIAAAALSVWPRSYNCQSTIMVQGSGALATGQDDPFRGASDMLHRRENLLRIVKETELGRRSIEQRKGLQRLKDKLLGRTNMKPEDLEPGLVWTVGNALWVNPQGQTLTFGIDWGHAETAAVLVGAAQKIYLEYRHVSEIATIQEKMTILDGHATKVRKEIDAIAEQLKDMREDKISGALTKAAAPPPAPPASASAAPIASAPRPRAPVKYTQVVTTAVSEGELAARKEQIALLKEELEGKKRALKEVKGQQSQALAAAQAQRAELLTRFTPAHPEVVVLDRKIQSLSEPPNTGPVEADIATLTQRIKELEQAPSVTTSTRTRIGVAGSAPAAAQPKSEALPSDILKLLDTSTEADPAVTVQLQGAISKYAMLRDQIRTARIELDTAQAAFNHRYKIMAPPEPPPKPSKPNPPVVLLGGFIGGLLLALLLPMLLELRRGKIVERWQVYQMRLPILAELRLPSGSSD